MTRHRVLQLALVLAAAYGIPTGAQGPFKYTFLERRGASPFSLTCESAGTWAAGAELRVAFDYKDDQNYCYLGLTRTQASLVRVAAGRSQPLAAGKPVSLGASVAVTLQRRQDRVRAVVDGRLLFAADLPGPIEGQAGWATSSNSIQVRSPRLQPVDEIQFTDDFARVTGDLGGWSIASGSWTNTVVDAPGAHAAFSANPFSVLAAGKDGALSIAGSWYWDNYRLSASVRPWDAESIGVIGYLQDERNYIMLRWREGNSDAPKAKQLVLVRNGVEEVLAEAPGGFLPRVWYRVELRFGEGTVEAWLDRDRALTAQTDAFGQGKVGLWAKGTRVLFDDVVVSSGSAHEAPTAKITAALTRDRGTVGEVYGPSIPWRLSKDRAVWWHRGLFYDDVTVTVPLDPKSSQPQAVILCGTEEAPLQGYVVRCNWQGTRLGVSVEHDGKAVQQGAVEVEVAPEKDLTIEFRDRVLKVALPDTQLLRYEAPERPTGRQVGIVTQSSTQVWGTAVTSNHQHEYDFADAPTDFFGAKGTWGITTRWQCQPQWTFFGGDSDENPVVCTKHVYRGDLALEFFMSMGMQVAPPVGYLRPSDLNASICVDGQSPGTGYSFVIAGWNNTKTAILRGDKVVAETDYVFLNPNTRNRDFHQHWFRVRVEKTGPRVALVVDDQPLLEYVDPNPLPDGRVALWTYCNWLMVARGYLWFAEEAPAPLPDRPAWEQQKLATGQRRAGGLFNDFERDGGEWHADIEEYRLPTSLTLDDQTAARGRRSLRITNMATGGPFASYAIRKPLRLRDHPVVSFDYRIPKDVKVNFYVHVGGEWHAVEFTTKQFTESGVKVLGSFPDVIADNQWHHASFDLLAALKTAYPEKERFDARHLGFSSPQEDYIRCGIGGNPMGASYWIDDFRLGPAEAAASVNVGARTATAVGRVQQ